MIRRPVVTLFVVALTLTAAAGFVSACDHGSDGCTVDRTCEKTETGMRCTVKAKGETTPEAVRACVRKHVNQHQMEGVGVTFADIEGGVVVTQVGATPEAIAALQAKAAGCAKDADAAVHAGCAKHEAAHEGCAKTAAAKDGCCAKKADAKAEAGHQGCAKQTEATKANDKSTT